MGNIEAAVGLYSPNRDMSYVQRYDLVHGLLNVTVILVFSHIKLVYTGLAEKPCVCQANNNYHGLLIHVIKLKSISLGLKLFLKLKSCTTLSVRSRQ